MSGKIFLSYRRDDTRWQTMSLFNLLLQSIPRERLFMDVEGYIKPGDDFVEVIQAQVTACEAMIVMIGPHWLSVAGADGRPRLHDPHDFVHIEVATALARRIRVIPVLADGARMPGERELPDALKPLVRRQAVPLSHERFAADGHSLVRVLLDVPGGGRVAPAPAPQPADSMQKVRPGSGDGFRDVAEAWCPEMVVVPAGSFLMGSPEEEEGHWDGEGPQVRVTIAKPFAVGRFPVTRGEFAAFVSETGHDMSGGTYVFTGREVKLDASKSWRDPGFAQDDSHPVVCVNWDDAKAYARWLAAKTGKGYRLLSEAEWEYACRAGTQGPFWWGASISTAQANFYGNVTYGGGGKGEFRKGTVPVKSFQPNPWGLYQVHGNVWEWCEDCWNDSHAGAPNDGSARVTGDCSRRVIRGGSWIVDPALLRAAARNRNFLRIYDVGFRLART